MLNNKINNINWCNALFFTLTPLVGVLGTVYLTLAKHVPWQTWVLAIVYSVITGLSITAGYHRLFAHTSYKATRFIRFFYLMMGGGAFQGSVMEWCSDHRNHHLYADGDKDPYSIKKGFWHAHILWLFRLNAQQYDFSNVQDLLADPLICWQQKYYLWIAIFVGFISPMAIASLWNDPIGGLVIAGALRMTLNHHSTFAVNSFCHYFGKRTYSKKISARDNMITSLFTYGEGFHNFHHQFPSDYRNGVRFYHYDPTKWFIRLLSYVGLAHNLKKIDKQRMETYRNKQNA